MRLLTSKLLLHTAMAALVLVICQPILSQACTEEMARQKVAEAVLEFTPELNEMAKNWALDPRNRSGVIHKDPLACRFCTGTTRELLRFLQARFPNIQWVPVHTAEGALPFLGNTFHHYVYAPKLNLMIDGSYRQYITQAPETQFKALPKIFVGTPDGFRSTTASALDSKVTEAILSASYFDNTPANGTLGQMIVVDRAANQLYTFQYEILAE